MFKLDKRLESDTILVKELESFQVRLMNAKEFFWIVLIPNKPNLTELSDLNINERNYLMNFAIDLGKFIKSAEKYDKVNIGMLGNVVSQLHLHIVLKKKMMLLGQDLFGAATLIILMKKQKNIDLN